MKYILILSLMTFGLQAQASTLDALSSEEFFIRQLPDLKNIPLKVGDFQERKIKKGILKAGSLYSWVDREEGNAVWLLNELKIIFKKKSEIEMLIEKKTGKILRYIVDGEEKNPPDMTKTEDCEEVSEVIDKIKVPAGSFESTRYIIQCEDDILAFWVNSAQVNMGGHLRQAQLKDKSKPNKAEYLVELVQFGRK